MGNKLGTTGVFNVLKVGDLLFLHLCNWMGYDISDPYICMSGHPVHTTGEHRPQTKGELSLMELILNNQYLNVFLV